MHAGQSFAIGVQSESIEKTRCDDRPQKAIEHHMLF